MRLVEVLALGLRRTLAQARAEGTEARALMEVLGRLGAEGLEGRLVVGDAGYVYPEVAPGIGENSAASEAYPRRRCAPASRAGWSALA